MPQSLRSAPARCLVLLALPLAVSGLPAQSPTRFVRGDVDVSGVIELSDALAVLRYLYLGQAYVPRCMDSSDADDSGGVDLTDAVHILNYLFSAGIPPAAPFPACGPDPTADALDCENFDPCGNEVEEPQVAELQGISGLDARPSGAGCRAFARPVETTGVAAQQVFSGLSLIGIVDMRHRPGDTSQWYLVRKPGYVYRFNNQNGVTSKATVLTLTDRVSSTQEGGLLGMAFHPNFAANGQVFLYYTAAAAPLVVRVSRFTSSDGGLTINPASEQILLAIDQPTLFHHGGGIAFGPDGYLYLSVGDSGRSNAAKDLSVLPGKILRIDVNGGSPYRIPSTNPFAGGGGRGEVYAWGFRNPYRLSFDIGTGELWAADVGDNGYEEVDRIVRGGNYGWPTREGAHCYKTTGCSTAGLIEPVAEYSHADGNCVIGGYVYRGTSIPGLAGAYVYGDWGNGRVWAVTPGAGGQGTSRLLLETGLRILGFAQGQDGEIFILSGDKIHKLVAAGGGAPAPGGTFPQTLSATGLFHPADTRLPGACLIPYAVNAPLWSDGADKGRWFSIPDGTTIHVLPDGDWELPIGTILVKSFEVAGRLVETRLFMRHDDGDWGGYSYEWNDAQTDATLLPGGKQKAVGGQTWSFPSRVQCLQCHTAAAGRTLGPETAQLNGDFTYPQTGRTANQLTTLERIGLFDAPLGASTSGLPALAALEDETESAEWRARSYLHANCSFCHRPEGGGRGSADFRYNAASMGVCEALPVAGDLGVAGARLLVPGDPSRSLISLRLHATDDAKMPPLARSIVDDLAAEVIDAWIEDHPACSGGAAREVILDNGQPGTSFTGSWPLSGAGDPYGVSSVYSKTTGGTYRYSLQLAAPGEYEVYLWWTQFSSRSTAVPISITHALGTHTVQVNQQANGGRWNRLGQWTFGNTAQIMVVSVGSVASTCADAVRVVPLAAPPPPPPAEIILDNGQAGTTFLGNWSPSGAQGSYGTTSVYAKADDLWYRFTATLPRAGTYAVSMWWTEYSSRSTAARVEIVHSGGTAATTVNQQQDGGQWNPLGVYTFGTQATITIRSQAGVSICADAVRFVSTSP